MRSNHHAVPSLIYKSPMVKQLYTQFNFTNLSCTYYLVHKPYILLSTQSRLPKNTLNILLRRNSFRDKLANILATQGLQLSSRNKLPQKNAGPFNTSSTSTLHKY